MGWKDKITGPEATTGTQFGGQTLNSVLDYLSGFDHTVGGTLPLENVDIATETLFATNTLKLWDSNKSHKITLQTPDYTENKTWTFPDEAAMGATDQLVFKDTVQTLTGKVLNFTTSNTAQNIPKSAISAPAVFTDQDNALGAHSFDLAQYAVPGNPASGTRRVHVDPSTGKLSIRRSDGVTLSLEEGNLSGAGGFAAGGTTTLSGTGSQIVFNIAHGLLITPDVVVVWPSSLHANYSRYQLDKDGTNITITYDSAPPSGTNNLEFIWGAAYVNPDVITFTPTSVDTLQNKTISVDANTIKHSTTNAAGDLLKGNGTKFDRLAKGTGYQLIRVNSNETDLEWVSPSGIFDAYIDFTKITPPADPGAEVGREYFKEIDTNNNTIAIKQQINGAIVEVLAF